MKIERKNTPIDKLKRAMYIGEQYWDTIRYDIPRFFKNLWMFKKDIYDYCWYSGQHAVLPFMKTALMDMAAKIDERGSEVESSRYKKTMMMCHAAKLIEHFIEEDFVELAEQELGEITVHDFEFEDAPDHPGCYRLVDNDTPEEREHSTKVFARAREIEESMWSELWDILKGQDSAEIKSLPETDEKAYDKWFNGTGLRGWWD
jgi:hypothetical protein